MVATHASDPSFEHLLFGEGAQFFAQFDADPKSRGAPVRQLALALQASPVLATMENAAIAIRESPIPKIGLVGAFGETDLARIQALQWQLDHVAPHTTFVDYPDLKEACQALAQQLKDLLGSDLASYGLAAIPRGGWFVLGMMSYLLEDVGEPGSGRGQAIVLDDVAYSGDRFARYLADSDDDQVIFAPLFSAAELRESIVDREPRVVAAVSARDLKDHAPDRLGDAYRTWRERWAGHEERYWDGQPDHVAFPWSEPDIRFWNEALDDSETGWRLIPPSHCLKNRAGPTTIQHVPDWTGHVRLADDTIYGSIDDMIVVSGGGDVFRLTDSAASIWRHLSQQETVAGAARLLSDEYRVDVGTAVRDIEEFVDRLVTAGVLSRD
ncbi:MAG: PqqD family protein [Acidimicrobiia bacterium]|nr:PqqD family protein [Acidimicrobiia bacterium]